MFQLSIIQHRRDVTEEGTSLAHVHGGVNVTTRLWRDEPNFFSVESTKKTWFNSRSRRRPNVLPLLACKGTSSLFDSTAPLIFAFPAKSLRNHFLVERGAGTPRALLRAAAHVHCAQARRSPSSAAREIQRGGFVTLLSPAHPRSLGRKTAL